VLIVDDMDLIITTMEDSSEDILQRHEDNKETLYERIDKELKDIQQTIYSSRVVPIAPPSSEIIELGDDPTQLRRLEDETKA
jgi:hypothetical protein